VDVLTVEAAAVLPLPPGCQGRGTGDRRMTSAAGLMWREGGAMNPTLLAPTVLVREVGPDEGHLAVEVFAGLSARSRYQRFHAGVPRLTAAMARHLAAVDGRRHVAFVAETGPDGSPPVGLARYIVTAPGVADVAVEVVDAWQDLGVGRRLVGALAAHARGHGITRFVGEVVGGNPAALALARSALPGLDGRWEGGVFGFSAALPGADQPLGAPADSRVETAPDPLPSHRSVRRPRCTTAGHSRSVVVPRSAEPTRLGRPSPPAWTANGCGPSSTPSSDDARSGVGRSRPVHRSRRPSAAQPAT
jgi:GNAT superfamily N-acetyltransferase